MAEQQQIFGDSVSRVAFDLMKHIAHHDGVQPKDRAYFLKLYAECYSVARGETPSGR